MSKTRARVPLPFFDEKEEVILAEIKNAGGDIFRTDLRRSVGGSNTTFGKKIASLKEKGVVEEYKRMDVRLKTAYKFTEYAHRLFNLEKVLRMDKWFQASQKIELFPEFERITKELSNVDVYKMLGIEPQRMFLETMLATSEPPSLEEKEVREVLTMCNALLQNVVTGRIHPKLEKQVEGYILFHYRLERPKEELQNLISTQLMNYLTTSDPLERYRASSKLVEVAIQNPDFPHTMTLTAVTVARSLKLNSELQELMRKYRAYKQEKKRRDREIMLTELMLSALNIFGRLHALYKRKSSAGKLGTEPTPTQSILS